MRLPWLHGRTAGARFRYTFVPIKGRWRAMAEHDSSYKLPFSHSQMVADLLLSADLFPKDRDLRRWVDVQCPFRHDACLGSANRGDGRTGLPIEVHPLELVGIGDVELGDTEPGEGEEMATPDAAKTGNGLTL